MSFKAQKRGFEPNNAFFLKEVWCSVLPSSRLTPNDTSYEHYTFLFTLFRVTPNEESANTERFHFLTKYTTKVTILEKNQNST